MKKLFVLFFVVLLSACNLCKTETKNKGVYNGEKNTECADFSKVQIVQIEDKGAFANVCQAQDKKNCSGKVVFLKKQWDMKLVQDKFISPKKDKCFTIDGKYKYKTNQTKKSTTKTALALGIGYKFSPKSEEEAKTRLLKASVDFYKNCYVYFENEQDKALKAEGEKLCACIKNVSKELHEQASQIEGMISLSIGNLVKMESCFNKYPKAADVY